VRSALAEVKPTVSAFFPGPLDGFSPISWPERREADIRQVQELLKERASFKEAPGLLAVAYSGGVDAHHIDELMRMLEGSNRELAVPRTAYQILKCCAYVASTARSPTLADAVITRCLRLVTTESTPEQITPLMLFATRACGAYEDLSVYYREIGKVAARFSYAIPTHAIPDIRAVIDTLCERDPKLSAALGRAILLLDGALLAA
jgi:hypothetical protein